MKKLKLSILLLSLLIAIVVSVAFSITPETTQAATTGTIGGFMMPNSGYATHFYVDVHDPWGLGWTIYLKSNGNTIASYSSSQTWEGYVSFSPVWVNGGEWYVIEVSENPMDGWWTSAHLQYTPYFLISVSSSYGNPTSSAWVIQGGDYGVSVTSPVSAGEGARYVCTGYHVDGGNLVSGTSYTFYNVQTSHTISFDWQLQYYLTVNNGGHSTASGADWYNAGATAYAGLSDGIVGDSSTRYVFYYWTTGGTNYAQSSGITMNSPVTATAVWQTQYYLTVNANGHGTPLGAGWYNAGGTAYFSIDSVVSGGSGTQYVFTSWSGSGSGSYTGSSYSAQCTMSAPIIETANWQTQYYLTVNGGYSTGGGYGWYNAGSYAQATLSQTTVSGGSGVRYVFAGWTDDATGTSSPSNNILMNAPKTAGTSWTTQYYLTVNTGGVSVGTSGEGWYNSGATAYAGLASGTVADGEGKRYSFLSWSEYASGSNYAQSDGIVMSFPKTAIATWTTQYYLTVSSAYETTSGEGWYNSGATAYAGLNVGTHSLGTGARAVFTSWSTGGTNYAQSSGITMNAAKTATASWTTQYYLTVNTGGVSVGTSGENWYNDGATAYAGLASGTVTSTSTKYLFQSWGGDATGNDYAQSSGITMNAAKTATASWTTQYKITSSASGGAIISPNGETWVTAGQNQFYNFSATSGYYYTGLTVDGTPVTLTQGYTFTNVNAPHSISIGATEFGSNLIADSSFDLNTGSVYWNYRTGITSNGHSGTYCAYTSGVNPDGTALIATQRVNGVSGGTTYFLDGYMRGTSGSLTYILYEYSASNALLASFDGTDLTTIGWHHWMKTFTTHANTAWINVTLKFVATYPNTETIYIDDIRLYSYQSSPSASSAPVGQTDYGTWYFRNDTATIMGEFAYKLGHLNSNAYSYVQETISADSVRIGVRVWYYNQFNQSVEVTNGEPVGIVTLTDATDGAQEFIGYWNCPKVNAAVIDHIKIVLYFETAGLNNGWTPKVMFLSPSGLDDIANYIVIKNCTADIHYWLDFQPANYLRFNYGSAIAGNQANSYINLNTPRADPWSISFIKFSKFDLFGGAMVPWTWILGSNLFLTVLFLGGLVFIIAKHGSLKMVILLCWILGGSGSLLWAIVPESGLVVAALLLAFAMGGTLFKLFHR